MKQTQGQVQKGQDENSFDEREDYFFVGRKSELTRLRNYLEGQSETRLLWNIHGTGGIGKTALLAAFGRMAKRSGAAFLLVDSGDVVHREDEICRKLLSLAVISGFCAPSESGEEGAELLESCVNTLRTLSRKRRVIVAFDTFEEFADIEAWLRERLFSKLVDSVLLIISGRQPLGGSWISSPVWREFMQAMSLAALKREEAVIYAERCGLLEDDEVERIWLVSHGHPLALSLAAAYRTGVGIMESSATNSGVMFHEMVGVWLKEVTDPELRRLVEAASLTNQFNASLLATALDVTEIPAQAFDRLIRISFIRKAEQGWAVHNLVRNAIAAHLRESKPDHYEALTSRLACYFANRIVEFAGNRDVTVEVGELYQYVGGETVAALQMGSRTLPQWEQINSETLTEAERYLRSRVVSADKFVSVAAVDPASGRDIRLEFSDALIKSSLQEIDAKTWYHLDNRSLFLLRGADREAIGMAAILPIHTGTLDYLEKDPFSAPYMATLSLAVRRSMEGAPEEPVGWLIRTIDYRDWTNHLSRNKVFPLFFNYLCAGKLILASPPPIDLFLETHKRMGFEAVPGSEHDCYNGIPVPMLVLDTRGERLVRLLNQLLQRAGIHWRQDSEPINHKGWELLSVREREVAQLVVKGLSNADIAMRLYISEVTVKKHLSTIFAKLGLKRRSQLAPRLGLPEV